MHELHEPHNISEEEARRNRQFIARSEETGISNQVLQALEDEKKPTKQAREATDFALTFLTEPTVYSLHEGLSNENPLLQDAPYKMDNASFVYWCYKKAGVQLRGEDTKHSIQTIKNDFHLQTVGNIGANLDHESLAYGDILFFFNDKHIGIYVGEGDFISFVGSGANNYSGGLRKRSMIKGKWRNHFQGHVLRHREEV